MKFAEALLALNPYWGKTFWEVIVLFFTRLGEWMKGGVSLSDLAPDEIQLLVLFFAAISCALVGAFLILRQMTMLANSLSHTILMGIVLAYLIMRPFYPSFLQGQEIVLGTQTLLLASLLTGLLTTLLTQFLIHFMRLQEDASIGLVFTSLFAIGIVLVTIYTKSAHIGTEAIMGNADALHIHDLKLISLVTLVDFLFFFFFFKEFKITAFDPQLANSLGISYQFFNYLLMVLVSATCIGAFRAIGVLLVLAFLVGPPLTARFLTDRLGRLLVLAVCIGGICSFAAVALARHLLSVYQMPLSTGGLVVVMIALAYFLAMIFSPKKGLIAKRSSLREKKGVESIQ